MFKLVTYWFNGGILKSLEFPEGVLGEPAGMSYPKSRQEGTPWHYHSGFGEEVAPYPM